MENKTKFIWIFLLIGTIINFTIVLFPQKKILNVPAEIKIQKEKVQDRTLEVNDLFSSDLFFFEINNKKIKYEKINQSNLKNNRLGTYYVLYQSKVGKYREVETYQKVDVIDIKSPNIYLEKGNEVEIPLNSEYKEPGYMAIDNYDGDVTQKVKVSGKVNTKKEGMNTLRYKVSDQASNEKEVLRKVIVKKDANPLSTKEDPFDYASYSNTASQMDFYEKGIKIKGYVKNKSSDYKLKIGKKSFPLSKKDTFFYEGEIDLTKVKNGTYFIKIEGKKEENLLCKIDHKDRLQRAHIGRKLITFSYTNKDEVKVKIEPFFYQYDILIDPGHGGEDTGAITNGYIEKDINLEQSLYEKKRFEEHGLKVKMIREDDTYGTMLGNRDWHIVTRRAFAIGYYGAVSKIAYSNHHNSSSNKNFMGWELLVPASLSYEDLKVEHQIISEWNEIYPLKENHIRMYARDYNNDTIYNKINGQIYSIKNYYAVNRIPYKSYFTKVPIYEGAFMSNQSDFEWYYQNKNYKKLSEIKIKSYVESLGLIYQKPKEEV